MQRIDERAPTDRPTDKPGFSDRGDSNSIWLTLRSISKRKSSTPLMAGVIKEAVLLLLVVVSCCSTPDGAMTDDSKMAVDRLDDLNKDGELSYDERKFKANLLSAAAEVDPEAVDNETGEDAENDANARDVGEIESKYPRDQRQGEGKRKYAFRSDLGKRSPVYFDPEIAARLGVIKKRYRSFKADLGKRYSRFRADLGKRLDGDSTPNWLGGPEVDAEEDEPGFNLVPEKRPRFRADLGKRARYEASRRVFRADLGKRRMFRSDLG